MRFLRFTHFVRFGRNDNYYKIINVSSRVPLRRKTQFAAAAGSPRVNCPDYIIEGP